MVWCLLVTSKIRGRLRDLCLGVGWRQIQFSTVEMFCTFHDSHKNHKPNGKKYYAGTYFRHKDQLGMKSDLTSGQKLVDPLSMIFHHLVFVLQELDQCSQWWFSNLNLFTSTYRVTCIQIPIKIIIKRIYNNCGKFVQILHNYVNLTDFNFTVTKSVNSEGVAFIISIIINTIKLLFYHIYFNSPFSVNFSSIHIHYFLNVMLTF